MTRLRLPCMMLALFPVVALADLAGDSGAPDPVVGGIEFNNGTRSQTPTGWTFELGKGVNPFEKSGSLPPEEMPDVCNYTMTVHSFNYGPAPITADYAQALKVGVAATFPDDSTGSSSGKLCFGTVNPYEPGYGCTGTSTILLSSGTTKLVWTIDPDNQLKEWKENNNVVHVTVKVPSPCHGASGEVVMAKPAEPAGSSGQRQRRPQPRMDMSAIRSVSSKHSRERLGESMQFTHEVRPAQRPSPFKPDTTRTPPSGR
jgi:hypothetical protein